MSLRNTCYVLIYHGIPNAQFQYCSFYPNPKPPIPPFLRSFLHRCSYRRTATNTKEGYNTMKYKRTAPRQTKAGHCCRFFLATPFVYNPKSVSYSSSNTCTRSAYWLILLTTELKMVSPLPAATRNISSFNVARPRIST